MNRYDIFVVQTSTVLPSMPQEPTEQMNWEIPLLITYESVEVQDLMKSNDCFK